MVINAKKISRKNGYKIYGYCLMENHIHLLIKEEKEALEIIMRRIGASYVYWYNLKYNRYGHLFQDRYKSEVVEDESYFLTVLRYIHQNPVKAGIVADAANYNWSSYNEYVGKRAIVDTDFALRIYSSDREKALESFKRFHWISSDDLCLDVSENKRLTDKMVVEIIKQKCRVNHCSEIQSVEKDQRDRYLKFLKEEGLSTRQNARLTGISRGIVLKA
ncbi:transposase [Dehalobacterium formicoaceticum]